MFYYGGMPTKTILTDEMKADLASMGDKAFSEKWHIHRTSLVRIRKREGIKPFNNQHGTKEHKFEKGIEYKWCQKGHWEPLENFHVSRSRWDGHKGWCKTHCKESQHRNYYDNGGKEKHDEWKNTDNGRNYLRRTWRRKRAEKSGAYVFWDRGCEERAYAEFDNRCAYCGVEIDFNELEFDHFVPVVLGGITDPSNMVPSCWQCNRGTGGKFKRDAMEWMTEKFGEQRAILLYRDIKKHLKVLSNLSSQIP